MTPLRRAGFTLLEVLAALAVLGLVLLALTQGVQFGLRAWHTQSVTLQRHAELAAVDRTLRLLVERMIGGGWLRNRGPLLGGAAGLDIVTVLPPGPDAWPDRTVDARLSVDAAHRLVLRWVPQLHAGWLDRPPAPQATVLLSGVERLEIAYWQAEPGGGIWRRDWTTAEPPALVRIRIVFPAGDARRWPDIVAAPRIDHALSSFRPYAAVAAALIAPRRFNPVAPSHAG